MSSLPPYKSNGGELYGNACTFLADGCAGSVVLSIRGLMRFDLVGSWCGCEEKPIDTNGLVHAETRKKRQQRRLSVQKQCRELQTNLSEKKNSHRQEQEDPPEKVSSSDSEAGQTKTAVTGSDTALAQNMTGKEGEPDPGDAIVRQTEASASGRKESQKEIVSIASYGKSSTFPPSRHHQVRISKALDDPIFDNDASNDCPPYGCKSVMGRRAKMEDTFVAIPHLLDISYVDSMNEIIPPRIASQIQTMKGGEVPVEGDDEASRIGKQVRESLHFFGVFDGHGGADAAHHCKDTMHEKIKDVISKLEMFNTEALDAMGGEAKDISKVHPDKTSELMPAERVPSFSRSKHSRESSTEITFSLSRVSTSSEVHLRHQSPKTGEVEETVTAFCSSEAISNALAEAFRLTDEAFAELGGEEQLSLVGTTAVVALISSKCIYVANCGDSRAVLSRNGKAAALTDDHKAAREDETARVEAAGGQILFWNGVRVMGLLAVSRAIGDHSLRPYVIADPEVTVVNRHPGDELLVLASDGLWDVMNNEEACALAKKCLMRARQKGSSRGSASRVAATVLTRAAVDRGSRDNVTVLVIDLMQDPDDMIEADAFKMRLSGEILLEDGCLERATSEEQVEEQPKTMSVDSAPPTETSDAETALQDVSLEPRSSAGFKSPFEMMDG